MMSARPQKIVVLGYLIRGPIGGMAWHHLQYVLGLKQLGHEVLFLEESDDYPSCYDPSNYEVGTDPSYGLQFATRVFSRLGLPDGWAYYDAHTDQWLGAAAASATSFCKAADLVLNISGVNPLRPWLANIPRRVLIDTDPVFTQVKNLTDSAFHERVVGHTDFFSFGEQIASGTTDVPDDGIAWQATRQPIVLSEWPVSPASTTPGHSSHYTTVMQWQSYASVTFKNQSFGTKKESFGLIEDLPQQGPWPLEIALGSASAPRERLREIGWHVRDPLQAAPDPWSYQDYLRQSRGELSVAKHAYASTRSGWFSERSACYLAAGRPVVVQDTGFSKIFPVGVGLHAFASQDDAIAALEKIERDYAGECRRARELAEMYFASELVLNRLLQSLVAPAAN